MAWLHLNGVMALVAMGACSCAAATPPPAASPAVPAQPPADTTTVVLTSAEVNVPSPATSAESVALSPARWSDADIVAALQAADAHRENDADAARARSKSVRVDRFAGDVLQQERDVTREEANLVRSLGATKSPLEERVEEALHFADVAALKTQGSAFDHDFMDGEIRYEHQLMSLIDVEMLPSAKSPELQRFLQSLRAMIEKRIVAAEEVSSNLP